LLLEHFYWIASQKLFFHETTFLFIVSYRSLSCDSICFHNKNNHCHHCTILLMKYKLLQCHYTLITYWIIMKNTKVTRILCLCSSVLVSFLGFNLRNFLGLTWERKQKWKEEWYQKRMNENIQEVETLIPIVWPNVSFTGRFSPNPYLKNMISIYRKDFPWK
jgi:hypothetical protein